MKKWTKILAIVLSLGILLSMAGCGSRAAGSAGLRLRNPDADAIPKEESGAPTTPGGSWMTMLYGTEPVTLQTDMKLEADYSAVDPALLAMLAEAMGMDFQWLQSLGLSAVSGREGDRNRTNFVLRLNDTDILQGDYLLDLAGMNMYLGLPALNPSYTVLDLSEAMSQGVSPYQPRQLVSSIDPELVKDIVLRYFGLLGDSIEKVAVNKGSVSAGGIRTGCTVARVTFGGEELLAIARSFLTTAATDSQVEDLVYQFMSVSGQYRGSTGYFHSSYAQWIEDALAELDETSPEDISESFVLTFYIDDAGKVLGTSLEVREDGEINALTSFVTARDGERIGVDATFGSYDSYNYSDRRRETRNEVTLSGSGTYTEEGKLTGSFQMGYYLYEDWNGDIDELDIPLFTLDVDGARQGLRFVGDVVITPTRQLLDLAEEEMDGAPREAIDFVRSLTLVLSNRSSDTELDGTAVLCTSGKPFLTLTMTASETESIDMTLPTDVSEPEEWASSMGVASLAEVILRLRTAGMPIELLNAMLDY